MEQITHEKPRRRYLAAFFLPFLILLISFAVQGVFPFGDRHILTIDLYHQYAPFLAELKLKLQTGDSLLYSWHGGMGLNFFSVICYYLASPLNLLLLLFPLANLTEAVLCLTLIKLSLAGLTSYYLLEQLFHRKDRYLPVAFSLAYALSGYSLAYSWNIMWLDSLYLMPLVILGLYRLVTKKSFIFYTLALASLMASNYYIAYFVCIFLALYYFPFYSRFSWGRVGKRERAKDFVRFLLSSLAATGLAMFVLLPAYKYLQHTSAAGDQFPDSLAFEAPWLDFLGRFLPNASLSIRSGLPNIYVGFLIFLLLPLFFWARHVELKTKILHAGLLIFLFLSFNINYLNFIWHGFHFPNQLPYRNSFVLVFLLMIMAYDSLPGLRSVKSARNYGLFIGIILSLILVVEKIDPDNFNHFSVLLAMIFGLIYLTMFSLFIKKPAERLFVKQALVIILVLEIMINSLNSIYLIDSKEYYGSREGYLRGQQVEDLQDLIVENPIDIASGRLDKAFDRTVNDPMLYGYPGLTIFSSSYPEMPVRLLSYLGFPSNGINSYQYRGSNIFLDSVLGIRYLVRDKNELAADPRRAVLDTREDYRLYENPTALPLLYYVPTSAASFHAVDPVKYVDNQNNLAKALGAGEDVLELEPIVELQEATHVSVSELEPGWKFDVKPEAVTGQIAKFQATVRSSGTYYLNFKLLGPEQGNMSVSLPSQKTITLPDHNHGMVELGSLSEGDKIEFSVDFKDDSASTGSLQFELLKLNDATFDTLMGQLGSDPAKITFKNSANFQAKVTAPDNGYLLFTTTVDHGWKIKIDGEVVDYQELSDGFILIPVSKGDHQVECHFHPEGLRTGLFISLASLAALLVVSFLRRRSLARKSEVDLL